LSIESSDGRNRRPPLMVETAARRAFRERRASPPARHVNLIFDSTRDELQRDGLPRVLLLSAAGFDAMLTVVVSARGAVVSGALMPKQGTRIGLRRPMLATIVLRVDSRGLSATRSCRADRRVLLSKPSTARYGSRNG